MKKIMTHSELQKLLTDSMDAMEQRLEMRMNAIEKRQNLFSGGVANRLEMLERHGVEREKTLNRVESKMDSLLISAEKIDDLKSLLAVWSKERHDRIT